MFPLHITRVQSDSILTVKKCQSITLIFKFCHFTSSLFFKKKNLMGRTRKFHSLVFNLSIITWIWPFLSKCLRQCILISLILDPLLRFPENSLKGKRQVCPESPWRRPAGWARDTHRFSYLYHRQFSRETLAPFPSDSQRPRLKCHQAAW